MKMDTATQTKLMCKIGLLETYLADCERRYASCLDKEQAQKIEKEMVEKRTQLIALKKLLEK